MSFAVLALRWMDTIMLTLEGSAAWARTRGGLPPVGRCVRELFPIILPHPAQSHSHEVRTAVNEVHNAVSHRLLRCARRGYATEVLCELCAGLISFALQGSAAWARKCGRLPAIARCVREFCCVSSALDGHHSARTGALAVRHKHPNVVGYQLLQRAR